jgi:alkylated DNA repair dioxygenase AlkB
MQPQYISKWISPTCAERDFQRLFAEVPWLHVADTRAECFMSPEPVSYTYGKGRGVRTYTSIPMAAGVDVILEKLNQGIGPLNVCFLNRYENQQQHLGWHADDHTGTDHTKPIAVISLGAEREIWWRPTGSSGVVPPENRQLLESGSLFLMPPGFQAGHQHRIPKGDRVLGPRISLTFRAFLPTS